MNKKHIVLLALLLPVLAMAQPGLNPLSHNPVLVKGTQLSKQPKAAADTVTLPFIEDFSGYTGYPSPARFIDKNVYVNTDFCIGPPTIGCATFDGLNSKGAPYSAVVPIQQGSADTLTSLPIKLGALTPADSVYFSFLYQPQGRGEGVEANDKLELYFNKENVGWVRVWYAEAEPLDTFKLVMLPITDTSFLTNQFRFMFINFGALYGMYDIWNVDYIYLDSARTKNDTTFKDVGFVYKAPSLLQDYQHMPYNQYLNSFTKLRLTQTNLDNVTRNVQYSYFGDYNLTPPNDCMDTSPANDLGPVYTNGYNTFSQQAQPDLQFCAYPTGMTQETEYLLTHVFRATSGVDIIPSNDTIRYLQKFSDYYAFDDGTAEASFFVGGANAQCAVRLKLNVADTLRALHFYFVQSYSDTQGKEFTLTVWKASATDPNLPGDVIYDKPTLHPVWQDSLNEFVTYYIDDTLLVIPAGENFFFGWTQTDPYDIQLGFDKNIDNADITFFKNSNNGWTQSPYAGSLMIRPAFGDSIVSAMGINEPVKAPALDRVGLYPNPAQTTVWVKNYADLGHSTVQYTIYNVQGALVSSGSTQNGQLDISAVEPGFYFVTLTGSKGQPVTRKLIIAR